ncbi:PilT domain-containing protein [Gammaproteobacteria bacterium]
MTVIYMMNDKRIFVDTGAYLARFHTADQRYQQAYQAWEQVQNQQRVVVTSHHVIDELATLLARRTDYGFSARKIGQIYASQLALIERSSERDEQTALAFFQKYADQKVSFTDCISFAMMMRLQIRQVFTFDYHFALAGFEVFPLPYEL